MSLSPKQTDVDSPGSIAPVSRPNSFFAGHDATMTPPVPAPLPPTHEIDRAGPEERLRLRADALEKRADEIEGWARHVNERMQFVESMVSEVDGFRAERARQIKQQSRLVASFTTSVADLVTRFEAMRAELDSLRQTLEADVRQGQDRMTGFGTQLADVVARQSAILGALTVRSRQITQLGRAVDRLGRTDQASSDKPAGTDAEADHELDALYLSFEDRARGSRDDVRTKQEPYIPLVREIGAGTSERPVLDLGSGRGEWLELLGEHGLVASGVDLNDAMVALCQDSGLPCRPGDALSALQAAPDNSVGMITGFHIIEHLPFRTFIALLDEALRVLAPGGAVLFETPNPQNVIVGSHSFYMDPTHRNPMPPEMVRIMAEERGFPEVEIRPVNPSPTRFTGSDQELIQQLDTLFYGPQDYAMIARKR